MSGWEELGGIGLKSSAMLCFLNMEVNCSYLQRNIFSQVSIHFKENIYYTFKKLKQEIIGLQTCRTLC